jgi:hypothetical protein
MHHLSKFDLCGGICADKIGLGKTLLAMEAMELAKNEPGSFSFVVGSLKTLKMNEKSPLMGPGLWCSGLFFGFKSYTKVTQISGLT